MPVLAIVIAMDATQFFRFGWIRFPFDRAVAEWTARARPIADACVADPALRARWLRCGGTWFVGVNVFPNDASGAVPTARVPLLAGAPFDFIAEHLESGAISWEPAQISVCFPGYPRPSANESAAAFRFRRDRDAAHVDALVRVDNRRRLGEMQGFILGLPLSEAPPEASPLVVWEGSHEVMRRALRARLAHVPAERWVAEDLTEAYVAARRECFETCRRVPIPARPGESYLIHRLALHGVAPWTANALGQRAVVYFRPDPLPGPAKAWLERP